MNELISQHLDIWTSAIASKSTAGRGSKSPSPAGEGRGEGNTNNTRNAKVTAYGIKKLRELILELAVRGKLVPQYPNDEPASFLLEKISVEKDRLVKEGKIKKQNPLTEINDEEKPFDLPENWKWTKLGNISYINPRNEADDKSIASFVPMSFITTLHTGEHEQEVREWKEIKNGYTHFANGDIGVAKITPCFENSKAVVFSNLSSGLGAGTTELHVARPYGNTLCARYILIYLKSPEFLIVGESKMTGTAGQKRIPKEFFAENPLPLPPLAEQHRIVAKVDELMALCDQLEQQQTDSIAAHQTLVQTLLDTLTQAADAAEFEQAWSRIADHFDTLFTTEPSIDQLKQTLLQLAVMGKLVPQDPNDESASVLLERVAKQKGKIVKQGNLKNEIELSEIMADEKPFQLPSNWCWARLDDLSPEFQNGASSRGDKSGKDIVVLRLADIDNWKLSLKDTRTLTIFERSIAKYSLQKNDILIIRVNGSADIVGRFVLCDENYDAIYCDHFIRLRFPLEALVPGYLVLLGLSNLVRSRIKHLFISTAGQKTVNQKHIGSLVVSVPPIFEQHRIVAKVDELMAHCDALKARIAAAQTTQLLLADTIVEQAVA